MPIYLSVCSDIIPFDFNGLRPPFAAAGSSRVLAEYQGFDGDGNGLRGHANAPQVDVIEIPEDDAVYDEDFAVDTHLVAENGPEGLRDVPVDHDVKRHALRDGVGEAAPDAQGKSRDALVGRTPLPAQCERRFAFTFDKIEGLEVLANGLSQPIGVDGVVASVGRLHYLQIFFGQQLSRIRDVG